MHPIVVTTNDASGGTKNSNAAVLDYSGDAIVAVQVVVNGVATYTVQQTLDNLLDPTITPTWFPHPNAALVGATTNQQGNYAFAPAAIRLTQTAGNGSARLTILQSGD
jgi:hypothetical protein